MLPSFIFVIFILLEFLCAIFIDVIAIITIFFAVLPVFFTLILVLFAACLFILVTFFSFRPFGVIHNLVTERVLYHAIIFQLSIFIFVHLICAVFRFIVVIYRFNLVIDVLFLIVTFFDSTI